MWSYIAKSFIDLANKAHRQHISKSCIQYCWAEAPVDLSFTSSLKHTFKCNLTPSSPGFECKNFMISLIYCKVGPLTPKCLGLLYCWQHSTCLKGFLHCTSRLVLWLSKHWNNSSPLTCHLCPTPWPFLPSNWKQAKGLSWKINLKLV